MLLAVLALIVQTDTSTYADAATEELIHQARQRHEYQDRLVRDYTALVRTRIDAGFGRSRFARIPPILAHETAARVTWALPNDLKVDILGARGVTVFDPEEVDAAFDSPWFIPRSLGDSIRFVDDELPATAALHPLAPGAERSYRFAIHDSVSLILPGRTVNAVAVRVEPKGDLGPSLIAGDIWLDAQTAEIVRMMFVYVGEFLWDTPTDGTPEDSADVRTGNVWASRVLKLEADLEYALYETRYWMPYRQLLQLTVSIPWFLNLTVPVRFLTTFSDYEVNTSRLPRFEVAPITEEELDGRTNRKQRRCPGGEDGCDRDQTGSFLVGRHEGGGRWELHYPPKDSMADFPWDSELRLDLTKDDENRVKETIATLGALQEELPSQWVGRMDRAVAWESFSDLFRYNRVQGVTLGLGYQLQTGIAFTTLVGRANFGLSDHRATGALTWRRDAPAGRLDIQAFRMVREVEPWTSGLGFGNSLNAVLAGHDDADYLLALGGRVSFVSHGRGLLRNAEFAVAFERQRTMETRSRSGINDVLGGTGFFPVNAPIVDGDYLRTQVSRRSYVGPVDVGQGAETLYRIDDESSATRVWGTAKLPFEILGRRGSLLARGGHLFGDDMEQMWFRVGGPQTVRGYTYGARRGRSAWAAQFDMALTASTGVTPVVFADVGNVGDARSLPSFGAVPGTEPLVGVGGGVSLLSGLIRFNVAKGLNPERDVRFDLLFSATR